MSAHVGPSRTAWLLWRWLGICGAAITRCTVHRRHFSTDVHGTARAGGFLSDSVVRHGTAWAVPIWARALSRRRHQSHECWELDSTPAWEERFARAREPSLAANPIIDILVARASQDEHPAAGVLSKLLNKNAVSVGHSFWPTGYRRDRGAASGASGRQVSGADHKVKPC